MIIGVRARFSEKSELVLDWWVVMSAKLSIDLWCPWKMCFFVHWLHTILNHFFIMLSFKCGSIPHFVCVCVCVWQKTVQLSSIKARLIVKLFQIRSFPERIYHLELGLFRDCHCHKWHYCFAVATLEPSDFIKIIRSRGRRRKKNDEMKWIEEEKKSKDNRWKSAHNEKF